MELQFKYGSTLYPFPKPFFPPTIPKFSIVGTWIPRRVQRLLSGSLSDCIQNCLGASASRFFWGEELETSSAPQKSLRTHKTVHYHDFILVLYRTRCGWQYVPRPILDLPASMNLGLLWPRIALW